MNNRVKLIIESWKNTEGNINATQDILNWINILNQNTEVKIKKISLQDSQFWFYDNLAITNKNKSFFEIKGLVQCEEQKVILEQPIIIQDEIGYLGIICKEINGVLNFLMQAKIEPGNINKIQISPTIQATKSNFTQKHGGNKPAYLEYFLNAKQNEIIIDQIQSEQSSRFYKKRNRNIIIKIDEDIEVLPNFKWMTLGQIKKLLSIDNLVNMDTRTVISCIPISNDLLTNNQLIEIRKIFKDKELYYSMFANNSFNQISSIYNQINDYKMFTTQKSKIVALQDLKFWSMKEKEYSCEKKANFKIVFCDISIEGREVKRWSQPLLEAMGIAVFGLFTCNDEGTKKFLVKLQPEVGCLDEVEIGPSVQLEAICNQEEENTVTKLFFEKVKNNQGIKANVLLSEEGGRFYHEQNKNIIIEIEKQEIKHLPKGYFWVDYKILNTLIQFNNCLNIQLRNLMALLEV